MTRNDVKQLIKTMMGLFPNFHPADLPSVVDAWSMVLAEYEVADIAGALKTYTLSDTSGFAPTVGKLVGLIAEKKEPIMGALEAWTYVYKAISNGYYGAEEEYAKLPPLCQKAIGSPAALREMAQMDTDVVMSVEQSHFIRAYNGAVKMAEQDRCLPPSMRIGAQDQLRISEVEYG